MTSAHSIESTANWLASATNAIAFTGAGISTESGIPDFRSPHGVWAKYKPVYFDEYLRSAAGRKRYWQQKSEGHSQMVNAMPNEGHKVLAKWEAIGHLRGVVTQNIDELHQQAGNKQVLELHGTALRITCLNCRFNALADSYVADFLETSHVPDCPQCGGLLKHATISFGQGLPEDVLGMAAEWCRRAELLLALGSSLVVTPAADLPRIAKDSGAKLVIVNRDATPLDSIADVVIHDSIGKVLTRIDEFRSGKGEDVNQHSR
jgi:NAD-dependent deacetylase